MHAPYLLPATALHLLSPYPPPSQGNKAGPIHCPRRAHSHTGQQHPGERRDSSGGDGVCQVRGGSGRWTNRARARTREGERERERKKSIIHGSRKISATLSLSARPLHSMCWNAEGRKQGQREAEASCRRWNCSLWQRWVVCSNMELMSRACVFSVTFVFCW